jgi:hypothetical protein
MDREWTDKRMDDFAGRVDRFEANVDARFDKVDRRFDKIDAKLDRLTFSVWGGVAVAVLVKFLSG